MDREWMESEGRPGVETIGSGSDAALVSTYWLVISLHRLILLLYLAIQYSARGGIYVVGKESGTVLRVAASMIRE